MQIRFFDDSDNAAPSDANTQAAFTAFLYELRRLTGRYGSTAMRTAAQAAAAAFNTDSNNPSPNDGPGLLALFGPSAITTSGASPSSGAHSTGVPITVTGTGFVQGTAVYVNGEACTTVVVASPTSITCTTPADLAAATYDLMVVAPNGQIARSTWTAT